MNCFERLKLFLLFAAGVFLTTSLLIFILGYGVPKARFDGYTAKTCLCLGTNITSGPPYSGYATLQHDQLVKNILILSSKSLNFVKNYLNVNFRTDSHVICYVNSDDIIVSVFSGVIAIIFGIVTLILGICFLIALAIVHFRKKRWIYENLDVVTLTSQSEVVPLDYDSNISKKDDEL